MAGNLERNLCHQQTDITKVINIGKKTTFFKGRQTQDDSETEGQMVDHCDSVP